MATDTHSEPAISADQIGETPRVSVVIPVFNEAGNLWPLAEELTDLQGQSQVTYEVVWINDGSTDDSGERLNEIADMCAGHRVIHLRQNAGQSAALAAGIDHSSGSVIVPMDGDGQNDPKDIPTLVDRLRDGYDCVSGIRTDRSDPLAKKIPSRIQTALTRQMCPDAGADMGCTLKAYRADALDQLDLRGEHHRYIPAKLNARGYRLDELSVNHRQREHGDSHYGIGRILRGFLDALYHLLLTRWGTRPIHLFGTIGVAMLAIGGLLGGHMLVKRLLLWNPIGQHVPRLILIAILTVGGMLVFALGLISELLTRIVYKDRRPYCVEEVVD